MPPSFSVEVSVPKFTDGDAEKTGDNSDSKDTPGVRIASSTQVASYIQVYLLFMPFPQNI